MYSYGPEVMPRVCQHRHRACRACRLAPMANDFGRTLSAKTANVALVPDGAADLAAIVSRVMWVGGRVSLLERALMFNAGRANRAASAALAGPGGPLLDFAIALSDITDVHLHSRLGITTIEVRWSEPHVA